MHQLSADEIATHGHREFEVIRLECQARMQAAKHRQKDIARAALELVKPLGLEFSKAANDLADRIEREEVNLAEVYALPANPGPVSLSVRKAARMLTERLVHDPLGNKPSTILGGIPILPETE